MTGAVNGTATLELLLRLYQSIHAEQQEARAELRDIRSLLRAWGDVGRRLDKLTLDEPSQRHLWPTRH